MPSQDTLARGLMSVLEQMNADYERLEFRPLFEMDVVAYVYHGLLARELASLAEVHLDSRVKGLPNANQKIDIAIGPVAKSDHSREYRCEIDASLALEVKLMFKDRQGSFTAKIGQVLKDFQKLARLQSQAKKTSCVMLCVDEQGLLGEDDLHDLNAEADRLGVKLHYVTFDGSRQAAVARASGARPPESGSWKSGFDARFRKPGSAASKIRTYIRDRGEVTYGALKDWCVSQRKAKARTSGNIWAVVDALRRAGEVEVSGLGNTKRIVAK